MRTALRFAGAVLLFGYLSVLEGRKVSARARARRVRRVLLENAMAPWPGRTFTHTALYCATPLGLELDLALAEAVMDGVVDRIGEHYTWGIIRCN